MLTQRQLEINSKVTLSMRNTKDIVDDLANQIRNPSVTANKMLTSMGGWAPALLKANQEGKSFSQIMSGFGQKVSALGDSLALLWSPTSILIVGIGLAAAAFTGLFKLFTNYWDFLDKKIMPAQAEFNKQIGGTSRETAGLKGQMNSAGVEMELLGYSFEEGAAMVRDLSKGLSTRTNNSKRCLKARKRVNGYSSVIWRGSWKTYSELPEARRWS
jgi:hypothetical protein